MKLRLAGVALALASAVAAAAGGVGTPEAYFSEIPQVPGSVDEARKQCPTREARLAAMNEKAKTPGLTPPAGASVPGAEEMKFMSGWVDLGKVQGEKIYKFTIEKERLGEVMRKCTEAVASSNVPDRHPGNNKCYEAFLAGIRAAWPDYLNASHDLVVVKGDYIAEWMKKAKDPMFRYRLTAIYRQGLWIHPGNVLSVWADVSCGADIP